MIKFILLLMLTAMIPISCKTSTYSSVKEVQGSGQFTLSNLAKASVRTFIKQENKVKVTFMGYRNGKHVIDLETLDKPRDIEGRKQNGVLLNHRITLNFHGIGSDSLKYRSNLYQTYSQQNSGPTFEANHWTLEVANGTGRSSLVRYMKLNEWASTKPVAYYSGFLAADGAYAQSTHRDANFAGAANNNSQRQHFFPRLQITGTNTNGSVEVLSYSRFLGQAWVKKIGDTTPIALKLSTQDLTVKNSPAILRFESQNLAPEHTSSYKSVVLRVPTTNPSGNQKLQVIYESKLRGFEFYSANLTEKDLMSDYISTP